MLLIEAGGSDNYLWIHIPVGYLYCIGNPRTDWLYQTEPDAGLNGRRLRYPRGKVLGGCSSINGMIYMRGQARDYDGWAAALGDPAWRWDDCLPYFMRHEDHWRGADAWHGAPGFDRRGARPAASGASSASACRGTCSTPSPQAAQQAGIPAQRRLQPRRQRRRRLLRGQPAPRRALEREPRPSCGPVRAAAQPRRCGPARR